MWGYGYDMMGWGWGWLIGAVLIILVVIAVIVILRLVPGRGNRLAAAPMSVASGTPTPRQILDERYAQGDLTTEEYVERVEHLGLT